MSDAQPRLFLERASYRRRRWVDAVRLLPFVGLFLWLVPLVWPSGPTGAQAGRGSVGIAALDGGGSSDVGTGLAEASVYMFVIWFLLIVAGIVVSRKVDFSSEGQPAGPERGQTGQ